MLPVSRIRRGRLRKTVMVLFVFPFVPLWMIARARWMNWKMVTDLSGELKRAWQGK